MSNLLYPIRLDIEVKYVSRGLLLPHDEQCQMNHGRTLDEMACRYGGLTPPEAMAILEDREFARMPLSVARRRLQEMELGYLHFGRDPAPDNALLNSHLDSAVDRLERLRDGVTPVSRSLFNMVLQDLKAVQELTK